MTPKTCVIEGCGKPSVAHGWCSMHATRWRRHGSPHAVPTYPEVCSIEGCARKFYARGWCARHYTKWKSHGSPTGGGDKFFDAEESFSARTARDARSGCLLWTGTLNIGGYGQMKAGGKHTPAHRYAWERANGPVPEGKYLDHICFRRNCVEVRHLRLATMAENNWNRSGPAANSRTGVRNVHVKSGRYLVKIKKDGVAHYGGFHDTIEEAAIVAERMREELFGRFAGRGHPIATAGGPCDTWWQDEYATHIEDTETNNE